MFNYLLENYPVTGWRGNEIPAFDGWLHGGGHVISGIWLNHSTSAAVGGLLAGTTANAVIDSLGISYHSRGMTVLSQAGGLVAHNSGTIHSCFTLGGNIMAMNDVSGTGGLVGVNTGNIEDSYSTCNILSYGSSGSHIGGLAGSNNGGSIMFTYAAGNIIAQSPNATVGGLVGTNYNGMVRFSYFDMQTTQQQTGIGNDLPGNNNRYLYGNTTADMKKQTEMDILDFNTTWRLTPGYYPALRWQKPETEPFRLILSNEFAQELLSDEIPAVKIFPNPTTGIIHIETPEENPDISVYDLNGKLIMRTTEKKIDFSPYPNGMYILKVNGQMEKVIKN